MKTHEFIKEMQELGYTIWNQENLLRVDIKAGNKYKTLAEIDAMRPYIIDTTMDIKGELSEEALKLCFLYSQTLAEDREVDLYLLKTDYDTGRDDYVYNTPDYQSHFHQILMLTTNRETAKVFDRETAIKIAKEYPYLELEKIRN